MSYNNYISYSLVLIFQFQNSITWHHDDSNLNDRYPNLASSPGRYCGCCLLKLHSIHSRELTLGGEQGLISAEQGISSKRVRTRNRSESLNETQRSSSP